MLWLFFVAVLLDSPLRDQVERLDDPLTGDVRIFLLKVLSNIDKFTDSKVNKKNCRSSEC